MKVVNKDLVIVRGDNSKIEFVSTGVLPEGDYFLTAKESFELTAQRFIDIQGTRQVIGNITTITFNIPKENTADLSMPYLYYDISSNIDDVVTTYQIGKLILYSDVRTPFDSFALPEDAVRFIQVDARNFAVGDMMQVKLVNGKKIFANITIDELKQQLGIGG